MTEPWTEQQVQITMDALATQLAPFLNLSVREALDKTRRLGKSPNLLSPAEFLWAAGSGSMDQFWVVCR